MSNSCISEGFIFYFSDVQKGRVSHQHILLSPMTGSGKEVNDSAVLELLLDFEFNSQVSEVWMSCVQAVFQVGKILVVSLTASVTYLSWHSTDSQGYFFLH